VHPTFVTFNNLSNSLIQTVNVVQGVFKNQPEFRYKDFIAHFTTF